MRAAVITQYNKPWKLKQLPDPKPAKGQVVIQVEASGMCGTDVHVHHGKFSLELPAVAGHEPVGKIVEAGEGVTSLEVGDRVGVSWVQKGCGRCQFCQEERPLYCPERETWMDLGGGNAEFMLAWAEGCTLVPKGLSAQEAAPVFCAGYTVFSGLRTAAPRPGERVAVVGMGGLGHLAVQFAKTLGLEVVAVTGTQNKRKDAKALGADDVIVAGDHIGKSLTAIGGADIILCTTNSAMHVTQSVTGLRPEGRLVNMGVLDEPLQVSSTDILEKQVRIIGSIQNKRRDLVEALSLVAAGKVKPWVEVYPIEEINEVRDRLADGKVRYRAVLKPK